MGQGVEVLPQELLIILTMMGLQSENLFKYHQPSSMGLPMLFRYHCCNVMLGAQGDPGSHPVCGYFMILPLLLYPTRLLSISNLMPKTACSPV